MAGVTIIIDNGNEMINCTREEEGIYKSSSILGTSVKCPAIDGVCYSEYPFACEFGYWNNDLGMCICSPGYQGDNCTNETREAIKDDIQLYYGTTEAPDDDDRLCIQNSSYEDDDGYNLNGKWQADEIYGIYMSYVKGSSLYLWFDTWFHMWIISTYRRFNNGYYSGVIAVCDLERFYVPDVTDCSGEGKWNFTNDEYDGDVMLIELLNSTDGYCLVAPTEVPTEEPTAESDDTIQVGVKGVMTMIVMIITMLNVI